MKYGLTKLETNRLLLRHWREADFDPFYAINRSLQVMRYFPSTLSREQSDGLAVRLQTHLRENDWGLWALERKDTGQFIGFTGLQAVDPSMPFHPAIEIGWRLDAQFWHQGFATEAANFVLNFAFKHLELAELVSFTAVTNQPSIKVMKRIGMHDSQQNFMHPKLPAGHRLQEHVLYRLQNTDIPNLNQ